MVTCTVHQSGDPEFNSWVQLPELAKYDKKVVPTHLVSSDSTQNSHNHGPGRSQYEPIPTIKSKHFRYFAHTLY